MTLVLHIRKGEARRVEKETQRKAIRLLKRGRIGLFHLLFSRIGLLVLMILLQLLLVFYAYYSFRGYIPHLITIQTVFVVLMVLYLINTPQEATAKITWLIFIMIAPVFGTLFLLYTRTDLGHRKLRDRLRKIILDTANLLPQDEATTAEMEETSPASAALLRYLNRTGSFPAYANTEVKYFPLGEDMFRELLRRLEEAERSIFLEFFIVEEGLMWGEILEVLARKAAEGVDVRVLYDGSNEFFTLPRSYPQKLKKLGIRCKVFAPLRPFLSTHYNYRDHRKILVIDGHTAFTGGVNLSDRYINRERVFGHWKDTAVMLRGEAARSFALMFLQMWNIDEAEPAYERELVAAVPEHEDMPGYVIPYADSPLDEYRVGELVYIDLLNRAEKHVRIMTPYLILDGELETALRFAAERGVEVELMLPGVPDKKAPYALAKTHYAPLLSSGVKIYEYTPGFVHAKVFSADGRRAVVGTINLDYRSLYHHFECAAYLDGVPCIAAIERDFDETLLLCRRVTEEDLTRIGFGQRLLGILTKAIASLL